MQPEQNRSGHNAHNITASLIGCSSKQTPHVNVTGNFFFSDFLVRSTLVEGTGDGEEGAGDCEEDANEADHWRNAIIEGLLEEDDPSGVEVLPTVISPIEASSSISDADIGRRKGWVLLARLDIRRCCVCS